MTSGPRPLGWSGRIAVHQIHVARRLTALAGGVAGVVLLWLGHARLGLSAAIAPGLAMSAFLVARGDLDRLAATAAGRRALDTITASHTALRAIGAAIALVGAWYHDLATVLAGTASIVVVWRTGRGHGPSDTPAGRG